MSPADSPTSGGGPAAGMTDLEDVLFGPEGSGEAKKLLARTEELQARLQADIAAGLPPEQFEKGQILANALAAARDLLVRFSQPTIKG